MTSNGSTPGRESNDAGLPTSSDRIREELVAFVRGLRRAGAEVPVNASVPAAEALAEVGLEDRDSARYALRAALLTRSEDRELFGRLFDQFWSALRGAVEPSSEADAGAEGGLEPPSLEVPSDDESDAADGDVETGDAGVRRGITEDVAASPSDDEVSRSTYSPVGSPEPVEPAVVGAESDLTEAATRRLTPALAELSGRRDERSAAGRRIDARAALRDSIASGGVVTSLPRRRPKTAAVRGVVFADVSRSVLDVLDRDFLVDFLRALRSEWRTARTFLFDTDVREVTDALDASSTADAYAALERAETEWGGGTRIGNALTTVRSQYPHAVDRRTVVLVISDGLEMGDVSEFEEGVTWLARRAPAVLWLNPLATSPEFEPTASGMATAVPHVDGIFPFAGPEDLREMARQLERYTGTEPLGYQQDSRRLT